MKKQSKKSRLYTGIILILLMTVSVTVSSAEWAPYTYYSQGTAVTYMGGSYTCRQSHTSLPGWEPPNIPALWLPGGTVSTATPIVVSTPTNTHTQQATALPTGTPSIAYPAIPARIEAENYTGMYGIQTEGTADSGGGTNVGWIDAGDWLEYRVTAASSLTFSFQYRVAALNTAGAMDLVIDGMNYGTTTVPVTGGWQTWTTISGSSAGLGAGNHTIRLNIVTGGFNINWIEIMGGANNTPTRTPTPPATSTSTATSTLPPATTPTATVITTYPAIPARMEAENYSAMYGIQTENTTDTGGGTNVGWIDTGDWLEYKVTAEYSGTYSLLYRVAALSTTGSMSCIIDGTNIGTTTIPATGGWQTWTAVNGPSAQLTAGNHTIRLNVITGGFNINWFDVNSGANPTPTPSQTFIPTATPVNGTWRLANLTNYTSYPDPNSEECLYYNGCLWAGYFAFVDGQMPESWVQSHNIIAVHSKDAETYRLKTFRLRQNGREIDAVVYDMCADSDCNGCCTANANANGIGFLIDIEKYTMERFGSGDGIVEWMCLDCQ